MNALISLAIFIAKAKATDILLCLAGTEGWLAPVLTVLVGEVREAIGVRAALLGVTHRNVGYAMRHGPLLELLMDEVVRVERTRGPLRLFDHAIIVVLRVNLSVLPMAKMPVSVVFPGARPGV